MTQTDPPPAPRRPVAPTAPSKGPPWAQIRADYAAGDSTSILAERYGLSDRTVRRRAVLESWPRDGAAERRVERLRLHLADITLAPGLAEVDEQNQLLQHDLLLYPNASDLIGFAFRRAAECAVLNGPTEALAWMRLVRATDLIRDPARLGVELYSEADYLRAAVIRSIRYDMDPAESGGSDEAGLEDTACEE